MTNPTLYSSFIYFLCGCFSLLELGTFHLITLLSYLLFFTSIIHHSRPYKVYNTLSIKNYKSEFKEF